MAIEYLSGIRPGAKIDLSQFANKPKIPSPETYLPDLNLRLRDLSERLNTQYGDFLENNSQIKMCGKDEEASRALIDAKESVWAKDSGKTKEMMLADREKNPANIAEIATTLLFDKVLKDEFIIVRASTYDDYENGADHLIIDKETGAIICGLDDAILGSSIKDDGEKKKLKIDKKMEKGGAEIKYGLTINEAGSLERKSLEHIPIFYFNLEKLEMNNILKSLASNNQELTESEMLTYGKLINSLLEQVAKYTADKTLHPALRNNLQSFAPSLKKMQNHIKENN
ncbi:MAG: hypothetical protein WCT50_04465 [Patescibacteria group bacterium]